MSLLKLIVSKTTNFVERVSKVNPAWGIFIVLALIIGAYFPSLLHLPRGDQWVYLLDTIKSDGFWNLLKDSYSFNRTMFVAPGDVALFRPVLFFTLALEKSLFGTFSPWHQLTNVLFHIIIFFLSLKLFRVVHSTFFKSHKTAIPSSVINLLAFVAISYFTLSICVVELVVWAHIKGYLVFHALALGALILAIRSSNQHYNSVIKGLFFAWGLCLLAAFTYELGQILAILIGLFLGISFYKRGETFKGLSVFLCFSLITIIYQGINRLDLLLHTENIQFYSQPGIINAAHHFNIKSFLSSFFSLKTVANSFRFLDFTILNPLFPSTVKVDFAHRVFMNGRHFSSFNFWSVISIVVVALWGYMLVTGCRIAFKKKRSLIKYVLILFIFIFTSYMGIIIFGRMNIRWEGLLPGSSYYTYMAFSYFTLFSVLAFCSAVYSSAFQKNLNKKHIITILIVFLIILGGVNIKEIYKINTYIFRSQTYSRNLNKQIKDFIDNNTNNKSLSFTFDVKHSEGENTKKCKITKCHVGVVRAAR